MTASLLLLQAKPSQTRLVSRKNPRIAQDNVARFHFAHRASMRKQKAPMPASIAEKARAAILASIKLHPAGASLAEIKS